jgi:RHS repeat-associated protein
MVMTALGAAFVALPVVAMDALDNPNQPRGLPDNQPAVVHSTIFGTDAGSPSSGAVALSIPIGPSYFAGGTLNYQFAVHYSSAVWRFEENAVCNTFGNCSHFVAAEVDPDFNAGLGWRFGLGNLYPPESSMNPTDSWVYVSPSGARHKFFHQLHNEESDGSSRHYYTRDGSYLRLYDGPSGIPNQVEFPDGTRHLFDSSHRLSEMRDPFGHSVTYSYTSNKRWLTITDGIRSHKVKFTDYGVGGLVVDYIDVAAFDGSRARYDFRYGARDIRRTCLDTDLVNNESNGQERMVQVLFLKGIDGPEGMNWDFTTDGSSPAYHRGQTRSSNQCSFAGVLEKMTYPTKGVVEWDYQKWDYAATGRPWIDQAPGIRRRTHSGPHASDGSGSWTYTPSLHAGGSELWTEVEDPLGNKTKYFTYMPDPGDGNLDDEYGLPYTKTVPAIDGKHLSREVRSPSGQLLRQIYLRFRNDGTGGAIGTNRLLTNRRVSETRTIFHDDGGRYIDSKMEDWDGLGHYRQVTTSDSWGSAPVRITRTEWNADRGCHAQCPGGAAPSFLPVTPSDPWVLTTFDAARQEEGGKVARQEYVFDPQTGALVESRTFRDFGAGSADPVPSNHDLLSLFCLDAAGQVISSRQYGGDLQDLSTATIDCALNDDAVYRTDYEYQYGFPSRAHFVDGSGNPLHDLFTSTINPETGLPSRSCDSAGYCQNLTYDDLGRTVRIEADPAAGDLQGATVVNTFTYDPSAEGGWYTTTDLLCPANSTVPCDAADFASVRSYRNGFGRPYKTLTRNADFTWSKQVTLFDAAGNVLKSSSTVPDSISDASAPGTEFSGYDAFGRPTTITLADGHVLTQNFQGIRVRDRWVPIALSLDGTETPVRTTETYDRSGRLVRVEEPSLPGGSYASASYTYGVQGQLEQILHTAGSVTQTRSYGYDGRGFLLSESIPERTLPVLFGDYDALGNAGYRRIGSWGMRFEFDRAGRALEVRDENSGGWGGALLKEFTYDGAPGLGVGKVATATAWNYLPNGRTVTVTDVLNYEGIAGGLSQRQTTFFDTAGIATESFTTGYSYDPAGQVRALDYPECSFGRCWELPTGTRRTVTFDYSSGRLDSTDGFATYLRHGNGRISNVYHANGVMDWRAIDKTSYLPRIRTLQTWNGPQALFVENNLDYDGAGNLKARDAHAYRYDAVSRLVESSESPSGPYGIQNTTFDGFGNVQSQTTDGSARTLTTAATSNRLDLAGTSYDARGNLLSWSGLSFNYDALNRLISHRPDSTSKFGWLFVYDANDQRVWLSKEDLSKEIYTLRGADGRLLREYEPSSPAGMEDYEDFIWSEIGLLSVIRPLLGAAVPNPPTRVGEQVLHATLDQLGSLRLLTDSTGAVAEYNGYFPFGQDRYGNGGANRIRFTGNERDDWGDSNGENDLDYLMARSYQPSLVRFLQVDPLPGSITSPQSLNRYAYVMGNPLLYVDPTGRQNEVGEHDRVESDGSQAAPFLGYTEVTATADPIGNESWWQRWFGGPDGGPFSGIPGSNGGGGVSGGRGGRNGSIDKGSDDSQEEGPNLVWYLDCVRRMDEAAADAQERFAPRPPGIEACVQQCIAGNLPESMSPLSVLRDPACQAACNVQGGLEDLGNAVVSTAIDLWAWAIKEVDCGKSNPATAPFNDLPGF